MFEFLEAQATPAKAAPVTTVPLRQQARQFREEMTRLQNQVEFLRSSRQDGQVKRTTLESEHKQLLEDFDLDGKALEVTKLVVERVSRGGIKHLEDLVTRGLQAVFTDDKYSLRIEVVDRGASKSVKLWVTDSTGTEVSLKKNTGGGIAVVISMLVRCWLMGNLKLRRFVAFDESFAQLSAEYAEPFINLLKMLAQEQGWTFFWITHQDYFRGLADHHYSVSKDHRVTKQV